MSAGRLVDLMEEIAVIERNRIAENRATLEWLVSRRLARPVQYNGGIPLSSILRNLEKWTPIQYVKNFDERLRYHLLENITRIEEEIRQTFAYKFDSINSEFGWNNIEAYDKNKFTQEKIQEPINDIEQELEDSNLSYVRHYKNNHGFIPTWIVAKNIRFNTLIRFIQFSQVEVKAEFCNLYGIEMTSNRSKKNELNFSVLLTTPYIG